VVFTQFLKDGTSSEVNILKNISNIDYMCVHENFGFTWLMTERQKRSASEAYKQLFDKSIAAVKKGDMLVLDEFTDTIATGLIDEKYALDKIKQLIHDVEIVLTGHAPIKNIMDIADYITYMESERHPFDSGWEARKGIEF